MKDLLGTAADRDHRPVVAAVDGPLTEVTPELGLRDALAVMQRANAHLAVVRDAAGTVTGIIALRTYRRNWSGKFRTRPRPCR